MTVHLVGAGPGDPGLITARGLELVRSCDVLVTDALVAQELIDEAPGDALVISRAGMKQQAVTRLLVAYGADPNIPTMAPAQQIRRGGGRREG